ncbi:MAG TPA: SGNH/GDSL hydrolase family protein [Gemmataceae bacterium]|nr:SGNH/GDSL hydrolase family protein [Gemmataceae bacterium]
MSARFIPIPLSLLLMVSCSRSVSAQAITYDFETHPLNQGWYFAGAVGWTTAQAHSPTHSVLVSDFFGSPLVDYPDGTYVAVDFYSLNAPASSSVEYGFGFQPLSAGPGWQLNTYTFRSKGLDAVLRVDFWGDGSHYIDDVTIRPVSRPAAAAIQDANIAKFMPRPFVFTPPTNRHDAIANSIGRLQNGQPLNVVMVGDSIIHDTFSTFFDPRVDRNYPTGARLNVHEVVASGAGAGYWSQNNRIRDQVMTLNPQLLVFGGVSTPISDIPLFGEMIRQARAINPSVEIVLMSPVAGDFDNPYLFPTLAQPFDPVNGTDYRAQLFRFAQQQGAQFWDMTTPWASYILNSGQPYSYFLRDGVHMNGYGDMLTGQIVAAYFYPVPEPSSLALVLLAGAAAVVSRRRKLVRSRWCGRR